MRIEFVNHASIIVEVGGIRLISDPWLDGRVFNDGWALLSPTSLRYEDFKTITHIWFSHEHPDHFFPPNVKKIPPECRKEITILYRKTRDRRVVDFCGKLGFKEIRELPLASWTELAPGLELQCDVYGEDSWLGIKTPEMRLLNLNDCEIADPQEAQAIKDKVGDIDVMSTQFSYASWAGSTLEDRRATSRRILERIRTQAAAVEPRYVIPFASFVSFCHKENNYMNGGANRIDGVAAFIADLGATPIVLYPGDSWQVGEDHSNDRAIERYLGDYKGVAERHEDELVTSDPVSPEELHDAARSFWQQLRDSTDRLPLRVYLALMSRRLAKRRSEKSVRESGLKRLLSTLLLRVEPVHIHLIDHRKSYRLDLANGFGDSDRVADECDISLSSDSLAYCLRYTWGSETLEINGRYRVPRLDVDKYAFFNYFSPFRREDFGKAPLRWGPLLRGAFRSVIG